MKLEDLQAQWAEDAKIDRTQVDVEAGQVPYLHHKWWTHYTRERLILRKQQEDKKKFYLARWEYYSGKMDPTEIKQRGWPPMQLRILREDIKMYLEADQLLQDQVLKIAYQEAKLEFIEDVLKQINGRGFLLNTILNYVKWSNGG